MNKILFATMITALSFGPLIAAEPPPAETDMKPLFNGKDLTGWDGDPQFWSVKDGVIHGETTKEKPAKGNTFLVLKECPMSPALFMMKKGLADASVWPARRLSGKKATRKRRS